MGKYFITGNAATGKSSIITNLKKRGFTAYDIEDELPDVYGFLDLETNEILDALPEITDHGAAAFTRYTSVIKEAELKKVLETDETVFLSANCNIQEKYYPLFDKTFGLIASTETLKKRLAGRNSNNIGHNKEDRAYLLSINNIVEAQLKGMKAIVVDTEQPLDAVVEKILSYVNES